MKVPKQDSDVCAKVDCFWQREGVASPFHYLPIVYHFPHYFAREKITKARRTLAGDALRCTG